MTTLITPPPPHLLKKFSTEARDESNKRNGAGYLKTFARLCIEWANSKSTPNLSQIRSSDITPPLELVQQWIDQIYGNPKIIVASDDLCLAKLAAQWGADQELEACLMYAGDNGLSITRMRAARRPKPPSLKEEALQALAELAAECYGNTDQSDTIRRALEKLDD